MAKITIPTEKTASNDDGSSKASSSPSTEQLDSFPIDIESVTNELSNDVDSGVAPGIKNDDVAAANDSADGRGVKKNDDHGGEERGEDFASSNPTLDAANNDDDGGEDATMDGAKIDGNNGNNDNNDTLEQQQRDEAPSPKVDEVIGGDLAVDDDEEEDGEDTEIVANDDDSGDEQQWELTKIMTIKELNKKKPTLCDYSKEVNGGTCQLVACSKWKDTKGDETWFSCLDCQQGDYEGWPDKKDEFPIDHMTAEHRQIIIDKCSAQDNPVMPGLPLSEKDEEDVAAEEDGGGDWDLTHVMTVEELNMPEPQLCDYHKDENGGTCQLVACSKYEAKGHDETWFLCLDCQKADYEGWPEKKDEIPISHMTEEHRWLIADKCSAQDNPAMPNLPTSLMVTADGNGKNVSSAITPPPAHNRAFVENQSNVVVGMAGHGGGKGDGKKKKSKGGVTPSPMPPKGTAKKPAAEKKKKKEPAGLSKSALEKHRKWQAEADKQGGGKIVVAKPDAKKKIFDVLYDEFQPMNINGISQKLKSVVPSIVLKSCLDDMVDKKSGGNPFAEDSDDDDDDGVSKKKSSSKKSSSSGAASTGSDEYSGSLRLKEGRNVNNNLYYVDHTKQANDGNGMLPDVKQLLLGELAKSKAEFEQLNQQIKSTTATAAQLESEPKNEQLILDVADMEKRLGEMEEAIEESKAHAANEAHVKKVRKEIDAKAAIWRKRKRMCIEFISNMEDCTEGTISLKKCLKGDGQIDIESDESCINGSITFASRKKARVSLGGGKKSGGSAKSGISADPAFVGVQLNSQGRPERVFLPNQAS